MTPTTWDLIEGIYCVLFCPAKPVWLLTKDSPQHFLGQCDTRKKLSPTATAVLLQGVSVLSAGEDA